MSLYLGRVQRGALFGEELETHGSVLLVAPVIVGLDLATLLFGSKHDDYAGILLPDYVPKVLLRSSVCIEV